jgi:hypothetical protein
MALTQPELPICYTTLDARARELKKFYEAAPEGTPLKLGLDAALTLVRAYRVAQLLALREINRYLLTGQSATALDFSCAVYDQLLQHDKEFTVGDAE